MNKTMAARHCYITRLPEEVVEKILCEPAIRIRDLHSLSLTCSKLWDVCQIDNIWRYKFQARWPNVYKDVHKKINIGEWRETVKYAFHIFRETRRLIKELSKLCYRIESEISEDLYADKFAPLIDTEVGLLLCLVELEKMVFGKLSKRDLTLKFYGQRVYMYLKHKVLEKKWKELFEAHPCSSSIPGLETGAVYLAQWFEPEMEIDMDDIDWQISELSRIVQMELSRRHRKHPAAKNPIQKKNDPVLTTSKWSPHDCRLVLEALSHVLYERLGFHGVTTENNEFFEDPRNSFIHMVIARKVGIPITMCILYASIAYRLGVICLSVNCPAHFMLKFIEHPELNTEEAFTYIDAFNGGRLTNRVQMGAYHPRRPQPTREPIKLITVMERMCRNLINAGQQDEMNYHGPNYTIRNALELLVYLTPEDLESRIFLVRLYLHVNLNLKKALNHMAIVLENDPTSANIIMYMKNYAEKQLLQNKEVAPKKNVQADDNSYFTRSHRLIPFKLRGLTSKIEHCFQPLKWKAFEGITRKVTEDVVRRRDVPEARNVTLKVGSIMRHIKYRYLCVIHSWDPVCQASKDWIQQMQVDRLDEKEYQPFYNVLVEDGSNRYAAQENLEIPTCAPEEIDHWEVGKYFRRFNKKKFRYEPNEDLKEEFPQDFEIPEKKEKKDATEAASSSANDEKKTELKQ